MRVSKPYVEKKFFEFFNFRGPAPKNRGPQLKFHFLQILGLGEDSASRKFERPSSKTVEGDRIFNQNLKILTLLGAPSPIRGPNQNSGFSHFSALVRTAHHEEMNVLARKL